MQSLLIKMLVQVLLKTISEELLKEAADKALDWIEQKVEDSESKLDDAIILPICERIRESFDISE